MLAVKNGYKKNYTIVSLNTFIYKNNSILEKNIYFIYLHGCTQKVDFFYFQEKVFFYRLLFEEIISEQAGRSKQWKYLNWLQKIEPNKTTWLYPMVDKKKIFRLLYQECEEIFLMSNRNKL